MEHIENADSEEEIILNCSIRDELDNEDKTLSKEESEEINEIKEVLNSIIADNNLNNNSLNDNNNTDDQNVTLTASTISVNHKNPKRKNYKKRFNKKLKKPSKNANDSISSEKKTVTYNTVNSLSENNKKIDNADITNKEDHSTIENVEGSKSRLNKKRNSKFNYKRISYLIPSDAIPIVISRKVNNHSYSRNYSNNNYRSFSPNYIRVPYESPLGVRSNYSYKNNYNLISHNPTQRKDTDNKYDANIKTKKYYYKQQYKYLPIKMNDSYYNHNPFPKYYNGKKSKENNNETLKHVIDPSENAKIKSNVIKEVDGVAETKELTTTTNG